MIWAQTGPLSNVYIYHLTSYIDPHTTSFVNDTQYLVPHQHVLWHNPLLEVFIETVNFINSSSIILVFINKDLLIKKYNIIIKRLLVLKLLYFTNGLPSSFITYYFTAKMIISHYIKSMLFYIIKLSPLILVILGMPWLKKYNLRIDFPVLKLKFDSNYYTYNCLL